ncbi:hypothetical protein [Salimicrobium halophilum]|uniref:Uncharacterized protein n=1 Tax=Salimicrobium halophilum TaxID=86666 RepID=A0A1G8R6P3_9BACI|nr:hypothetical protein [Salimicrobium halophilum]SDJ12060.1 hypothetical protein SAMN04490247_0830 [Salimicrobium halophilum]
MKTYHVLFSIILLLHTMTLINVTFLDGGWNGIVMWLSTVLFLIAVLFFSTEFRAERRQKS